MSFRHPIGPWFSALPSPAAPAPPWAGTRRRLQIFVHRIGGFLALLTALLPARADEPLAPEYQIKAAFLFNFVQFVEWPESAFPDAHAPLRIGVLGVNPFKGRLNETIRGETVRGRRLEVRHSSRVTDLLDCQIIFVASSERPHLIWILNTLAGRPILTVGESPDFARRGGIVNFYLEGHKVRFEINRAAARRSQLRLASQMVKLARLVGPEPEETK